MGKIADLVPQPEPVPTGNGVLYVHGLTLSDLSRLILVYRDDFLLLLSSVGPDGVPNYDRILVQAPNMVAEIIALAADAADEVETVKRLPAAVQLVALEAIWRLSVPDPKKLLDLLSGAMAKAQRFSERARAFAETVRTASQTPSTSSNMPSVESSPTS